MSSLSLASASSQYCKWTQNGATTNAMSCFFKTSTLAQQTLLYCERVNISSTVIRYACIYLGVSGSVLYPTLYVWTSVGPTFATVGSSGSVSVSTGEWYYVCGWWDDAGASGNIGLTFCRPESYVSYYNTASCTFTLLFESHYAIGSDYAGSGSGLGSFMNGQIAHATFWNEPVYQNYAETQGMARQLPPHAVSLFGGSDNINWCFPLDGNYYPLIGPDPSITAVNTPTFSSADPNVCEAGVMRFA